MDAKETPEQRLERVQAFSAYIDSLVDLIPPKVYLAGQQGDAMNGNAARFAPKKTPEQLDAIKKAKKHARAQKMDPTVPHSTVAMQKALAEAAAAKRAKDDAEQPVPAAITSTSSTAATSEQLRAKLAAKIAALQQKRMPQKASSVVATSSTTTSDISEAAKSLATALPVGKRNGKAPQVPTSSKSREQLLEERKIQKAERKAKHDAAAKKLSTSQLPPPPPPPAVPLSKKRPSSQEQQQVDVGDGTITLPKLEFGQGDKKKQRLDPKAALAKAERKKQRLAELKAKDADKAADVEESQKWTKLTALAQGERLADDVKSIKKAVKKQEQRKKKSSAQWQENKEKVKESQEARQKKRAQNIQQRKDEKLARKMRTKKPSKVAAAKNNNKKGKKAGFK